MRLLAIHNIQISTFYSFACKMLSYCAYFAVQKNAHKVRQPVKHRNFCWAFFNLIYF